MLYMNTKADRPQCDWCCKKALAMTASRRREPGRPLTQVLVAVGAVPGAQLAIGIAPPASALTASRGREVRVSDTFCGASPAYPPIRLCSPDGLAGASRGLSSATLLGELGLRSPTQDACSQTKCPVRGSPQSDWREATRPYCLFYCCCCRLHRLRLAKSLIVSRVGPAPCVAHLNVQGGTRQHHLSWLVWLDKMSRCV